jgi:hypothetical protein
MFLVIFDMQKPIFSIYYIIFFNYNISIRTDYEKEGLNNYNVCQSRYAVTSVRLLSRSR